MQYRSADNLKLIDWMFRFTTTEIMYSVVSDLIDVRISHHFYHKQTSLYNLSIN
jgi:hypothetical protein